VLASAALIHTPGFAAPEAERRFIEDRRVDFEANAKNLLYVALTRARETVTIFTVKDRESPFVVELLCDPDVVLQDRSGDQEAVRACLKCEGGILQRRVSRYGAFYKCSRWPRCDYKEKPRPSSRVNDLARLGVER